MSAGDSKFDDKPGSLAKLRALLIRFPAIGRRLRLERMLCFGFDIPYLGGISSDGKYVYIDRHLPEKSEGVPLAKYIEVHESVESALVNEAGLSYEPAHHLATAAEEFSVLEDGYEWAKYEGGLRPEFQPLEHEDITRVPPDLDLYPYSGPLRAHLAKVAAKSQFTKEEVRYREGGEKRKCDACAMFLPRLQRCTWVKGAIFPDDVCDKFEAN
jgi:hypothetical protein